MNKFATLKLSPQLLRAIDEMGFEQMTPIQVASISALMTGKDIVGQSKTGSGKTAAFIIPILQKIKISDLIPQALILCPTRELCDQVLSESKKFSKYLPNLKSISLIGGQAYPPQERALQEGVHLIVGTPGRTLEHLKSGRLNFKKLKFLVLDEADRLLEEGFAEELSAILDLLPRQRQTIFFSATFPARIEDLSLKYQNRAEKIMISEAVQDSPMIEQFIYQAEKPQKIEVLEQILKNHKSKCTLIFCRTKATVNEVGLSLKELNCKILHADLTQSERERTINLFRKGHLQILVATDVVARGIDIDILELVINFDLPSNPDIYIHRIGRSGRAGRKGIAVSIATAYEAELILEIEKVTGVKMLRRD